jgi:quercetin dioxygenase-like cupin family protein
LPANAVAISLKGGRPPGKRSKIADYCAMVGTRRSSMPVITGFDKLASVPEEQITDKIGRRVISAKQGTMVYWRMKARAHVAAHQHPQEQFVWVIKGAIGLRTGTEERTIKPGDVAVVPGGVEHEARTGAKKSITSGSSGKIL